MSDFTAPDLTTMAGRVTTRQQFVEFVGALHSNYKTNSEEWENDRLDLFLSGLEGFSEDCPGYYKNQDIPVDPDQPSWRVFAEILLASRVYE